MNDHDQELAFAVLAGTAIEVDHRNGVLCPHFPPLDWIARDEPPPTPVRTTAVSLVRLRVRQGPERWEFDAGRCRVCGKVYFRNRRHLTAV